MPTLYAPTRVSRDGLETPRKSKYEVHDNYILRHYPSLGPSQVAKNLKITPGAVIRRYQSLTGIQYIHRAHDRDERAEPARAMITLPTITLDRPIDPTSPMDHPL